MKSKSYLIILIMIMSFSCSEMTNKDSVDKTTIVIKDENESLELIKIGDKINLEEYKILPINGTLLDKSKIIILDFWATWCGPCIASFPHLEDLQLKYKERIQVINVSAESEGKIKRFLLKKNFKLGFFSNTNKDLFNKFMINELPVTTIISNNGEFLWAGRSDNNEFDNIVKSVINSGKIIKKANGKNNPIISKYYNENNSKINEITNQSILEYKIEMSNDDDVYLSMGNWTSLQTPINLRYKATPVSNIIKDIVGVAHTRVTNNRMELDTLKINILAKSKSKNITFQNFSGTIYNDLKRIFDVKVIITNKKVKVFKFKIIDPIKLKKAEENTEGGGFAGSKDGRYTVTRFYLEDFAAALEYRFKPNEKNYFISNVSPNKLYNFVFDDVIFTDIKILKEQLFKFGLTIEEATENIEFVDIN